MKLTYMVLKDVRHPDTSQGICRAGSEVELAAKQARYLLLSGHLALPPEPEPAPQPQAEPAAEVEGRAATENNAEPAADAPKPRSGRGGK